MPDALQLQTTASDAIHALDALTTALSRLRDLDDDPIVQGMLDSLLEQMAEADEQLRLYRDDLEERWRLSPEARSDTAELVRRDAAHVHTPDGTVYAAHVYGERRGSGEWIGWIVFVPMVGEGSRRTERETTQPSREALAYWAAGLEPLYFEGAFARAIALGE